MSYLLQHLHSGYAVDQAILEETERVVCIRFGRDWSRECMIMDETLARTAEKVKNFAVIYVVDIDEVPDFNTMYELYDPVTLMFFYRNKHMMIDLGTGNNNKINWPIADKQEFIDILETVYKGARKGRGLVISPKDYSTKYLTMSYLLQHLHSGYAVDQAILEETERVVCIRFGRDWSRECMIMDETLARTAEKVKNFAVIYVVDIDEVPDFNTMYELYDPVTLMFFFIGTNI